MGQQHYVLHLRTEASGMSFLVTTLNLSYRDRQSHKQTIERQTLRTDVPWERHIVPTVSSKRNQPLLKTVSKIALEHLLL